MSIENSLTAPPIEKETRLAVVMYGGVSLAIYIHGVAQELYHMVRATARKVDNQDEYVHPWKDLRGTEKVYRRLGKTLKTKFVVDILSGTSAGGLNAVFLAKAIVNQQPMEFVKNFWVREGDIATLLNDKGSLLGGLSLQEPTPGLMNSQRFYYKILEALMEMGSCGLEFRSPYVEQLDLNITATDIRGLNLPLFINYGNPIQEARYKNVFQFYYRPKREAGDDEKPRNDFTRKMDPFLAFAARCTASIPPAFEAMQLKDIEPILGTAKFKGEYGSLTVNDEDWKQIYKEYVNEGDDFSHRSFGDGGYLDNKPFSYATESLLRRRADFPVDRRLIYIEPSPEHPEDKPLPSEKPDMLENILAALVNLPRSETIREDLNVIAERNRVVRKVKHILSESFYHNPSKGEPDWVHTLDWPRKYLLDSEVPEVIAWYGNGYITYHQLRVESTLKDLSIIFSQMLGWNESGPEEDRLHGLLHEWLDEFYGIRRREQIDKRWDEKWLKQVGLLPDDPQSKKKSQPEKMSQNDILFRLDISFRMRKQHFLQHILNTILLNLGGYLKRNEKAADLAKEQLAVEQLEELRRLEEVINIFEQSGQTFEWKNFDGLNNEEIEESIKNCLTLLRGLKSEMNDVYAYLRSRDRYMRKGLPAGAPADAEFDAYVSKLKELKEKLGGESDESVLVPLIEELSVALGTHLGGEPSGYLFATFNEVSDRDFNLGILKKRRKEKKKDIVAENLLTEDALEEKLPEKYPLLWAELENSREEKKLKSIRDVPDFKLCLTVYRHVQQCLAFYYDNFEYYDMLTFPIQYGTDAGESDEVEVIRVSPEDATLLIDERKEGRKKLTGTSLSNFGAFFKKEWREVDMMWGRLDAAEIFIRQVTGWKSGRDEMDEDERKKWDGFKNELQEVYLELFPQGSAEFTQSDDFPFNLAFQLILEEDLRPRDDFIFYSFIDGKFEAKDDAPPEPTAIQPKSKAPPELQRYLDREKSLESLESALQKNLRENIGSSPDLLRKAIIDLVAREKENIRNEKEKLSVSAQTDQRAPSAFVESPAAGAMSLSARVKDKMNAALDGLQKRDKLRYKDVLRSLRANPHEILSYFKAGFEVDKKLPPETLDIASRGFIVFEKLLLSLSEKYPFLARLKGLIKATSRLGAGFTLAARGGSHTTVAAIVLYVSSLLLILAGWLISGFKDGIPVGLLVLIFTLVAHITVLRIGSPFFSGKLRRFAIGAISLLIGLAVATLFLLFFLLLYLGAVHLFGWELPENTIGTWIQKLIEAFSIK